jgi:phytoene desaturase
MPHVAVIGSGISGLAAACCLAKEGFRVTVFEKNSSPGGRARKFEAEGFTFDMGPSWYWMPDVFEKFFNHFGKSSVDFYQLQRLDPSYRIYFGNDDYLDVPADMEQLRNMFETIEPGSAKGLDKFLLEAKYKYDIGMHNLVYKAGLSFMELLDPMLLKGIFKLHVFQSVSGYVQKFFKEPRLIKLLQFPVLFLGATPEKTPALYTLMNYADMSLGTWYPQGGMYSVINALVGLAKSLGVEFQFNSNIAALDINASKVNGVWTNDSLYASDYTVAGADYHHVEQQLIPPDHRRYSNKYWNNRVLAPSCLLFYIGLNKKLKKLRHHTLFFDEDFSVHANEIYNDPRWPSAPQFYVSCPSVTDTTVAPEGHENLMILIPVAPDLKDSENIREKYFEMVVYRLEKITGETVRDNIVYKRSYAHNDFVEDYHAYKGNAYGLANTFFQTANFKPSIVNKKITNLFYAGQLTVPGPGVPPSLISGQVVAREVLKRHKASVK